MVKAMTTEAEIVTGFCSEELATQMQSFLGEDFTISSLGRHLHKHSAFKESRSVLHTFSEDPEVFDAQNATFKNMPFRARCEVDIDDTEIADYRILAPKKAGEETQVAVRISPNALRPAYNLVRAIFDAKTPAQKSSPTPSKPRTNSGIRQVDDIRGHVGDLVKQKEPEVPDPAKTKARDEALNISYTGVYSSIVARFAVERHFFRDVDVLNEEQMADRQILLSTIYESLFGKDPSSLETRLNRVAMSVGGAIMFRYLAKSLSYRFITNNDDIGGYLRVFALGTSGSTLGDENPVSFAMNHQMSPKETTAFMNVWFGRATLLQ